MGLQKKLVVGLTLLARYSGSVISLRQLSRSFVSPCEQVGEHHGGAGGCQTLPTTVIRQRVV